MPEALRFAQRFNEQARGVPGIQIRGPFGRENDIGGGEGHGVGQGECPVLHGKRERRREFPRRLAERVFHEIGQPVAVGIGEIAGQRGVGHLGTEVGLPPAFQRRSGRRDGPEPRHHRRVIRGPGIVGRGREGVAVIGDLDFHRGVENFGCLRLPPPAFVKHEVDAVLRFDVRVKGRPGVAGHGHGIGMDLAEGIDQPRLGQPHRDGPRDHPAVVLEGIGGRPVLMRGAVEIAGHDHRRVVGFVQLGLDGRQQGDRLTLSLRPAFFEQHARIGGPGFLGLVGAVVAPVQMQGIHHDLLQRVFRNADAGAEGRAARHGIGRGDRPAAEDAEIPRCAGVMPPEFAGHFAGLEFAAAPAGVVGAFGGADDVGPRERDGVESFALAVAEHAPAVKQIVGHDIEPLHAAVARRAHAERECPRHRVAQQIGHRDHQLDLAEVGGRRCAGEHAIRGDLHPRRAGNFGEGQRLAGIVIAGIAAHASRVGHARGGVTQRVGRADEDRWRRPPRGGDFKRHARA